ncbi:TPA: methyltransferase domain-containing protein [Citrobacter pasteurii]|uniref:methyltransferase domain-containing protein n=1 Tax=Citrobacter sp. Cu233 TaxID=2985160 RepID=UPI002576C227|nr:methyltransferase domain-containing protein [Citrobacter sp. Cu233]MDM2932188.1 class I SAM-dependent methyltransferase [Citrobacter sp. Cu233]
MTYKEQSISELVEQLPEVYQPIFKHPEFNAQASRTHACFDRLETITSFYDYISKDKGRPLKVLDLGCAQGFFSLNLAARGASVTAVDYSQPNINVCNKLADENNGLNIEFLLGSIETIVRERVKEQEYDLVLGLSVFHHLVYEHGADYVFGLFEELSSKVETGIFEFALNSEPLYWADAQPEEPRQLIESYTFNHNLSMHGTHLSVVERPLYFASNKYWSVGGNYGVIEHAMRRSHQLDNYYHGDKRRYYFSDNKIIKIFLKDATNCNFNELKSESVFLERKIEGFRSSDLVCYGSNESESWLVRTLTPGRLLLDIILAGDKYDDEKIVADILEQITLLEENGLYHNDLRLWNILLGDDGKVHVIDYGSISNRISDGDDLYGQILSFFALIKEIAHHKIREQESQRPQFISPHDFPEKYKKWLTKVWLLPSHQWNFKNIYAAFLDQNEVNEDIPVSAILESYLSSTINHMNWQIKLIENKIVTCDSNASIHSHELDVKLSAQIDNLSEKIDDTNNRITGIIDEHNIENQLRNELNLVYASTSWKITYPLRLISTLVRKVLRFRG